MIFEFQGTQQTTMEIFEGAAVGVGSAVTARNNNRNSDNTTALTMLQTGGAVSTAGTSIYSQSVGVAGNVNRARMGLAERDNEIILKQNTTYRFVFTSAGNDNLLSYCGEWYEHTTRS